MNVKKNPTIELTKVFTLLTKNCLYVSIQTTRRKNILAYLYDFAELDQGFGWVPGHSRGSARISHVPFQSMEHAMADRQFQIQQISEKSKSRPWS